MGQAELDLLQQIYADWGRGDYSRAGFVHPDFELIFAGGFLDLGSYRGPGAALRGWRTWLEQWESWNYRPVEFLELDDGRIAAYIDIACITRTTRMALEFRSANLWEFEAGVARRLTIYQHRDEMVDELGLDAP